MRNWALLLLLLNQSCSGEHKAPPPLAECGSTGCHPFSGGSQQGTGGGGNADIDAGASLVVNAVAFTGVSSDSRAWSLLNVSTVSESVEVQALSVSGTVLTKSGFSPVELAKVDRGTFAWASVRPTAKTSVYLPGILSIVDCGAEVSVPLLLSDDLSFVSRLYTTTTLSLDATKAQAVVKIIDAQGNGVKNARITNPGADTVAYANQGTWVDGSLDPVTDTSGRVVLINFPASASPGGFVTIAATGKNTSGKQVTATTALPIEAGFVSYGTILLNLG